MFHRESMKVLCVSSQVGVAQVQFGSVWSWTLILPNTYYAGKTLF